MDSRLRTSGKPDTLVRAGLIAAGLVAIAAIGYLHHRSGLAYEFHIFFLLPAAGVAWFAGWWPGAVVAVVAVLVWGITDWHLGGATGSRAALLFNSGMRLGVFLVVVWLLARLRIVLARETELAHHDPLTGLPNRRMFYAEGELALAQVRRRPEACTAMFIDIDHFKQVNDELGHKAGDELLRAVAEVLHQQVRGSDIVGRLGGDEFAVLLPGMAGDAAATYAEKLRERLREKMSGQRWPVSFSIGLACFHSPPQDIDTLVKRADALMYQAKRGGRDAIRQETYDGGAAPARAAHDR
jgi:diguanylate cyclase (GGDEF)-like protein